MRVARFLTAATVVLALAGTAMAQVPTGTISGVVTFTGDPLPGVTVVASSPALQGQVTAVTSANGDYILRFLPPGDYNLTFSLASFATLKAPVKVLAVQARIVDAQMYLEAAVEEEIVVTAALENISSGTQASTTFESDLMEKLPTLRTMNSAVLLAPNTAATGPGNNIVIAGSQSHESLYLINGVVVNENLRGQSRPLFIEDAIQETTTSTSGVSAEYGRFAGGVVNMITKSGGNDFSGSLRLNLTNDKWVEPTPVTESREDSLNKVWEATFGGYILRDKLWFFLAGRDTKQSFGNQTAITNLPFTTSTVNKRYEAKLTWALTDNHRFIGSYIDIDSSQTGSTFQAVLDYDSVSQREDPESLFALNYTGILTPSFFVQAQYSERKMTIAKGFGGTSTDLIGGTVVGDYSNGWYQNAPWFCAICGDETRDNKDYLLKGSYFASSERLGSHDIVFGYDQYHDMMTQNNHQTASDWIFWVPDTVIDGPTAYPVVIPWATFLYYWPLLEQSQGTDFQTASVFVNDTWRLNNNWSFNLGLRYDQNDGKNSAGDKVAKDSRVSPRLGVTWDPKGDGQWQVNAAYSHYVTALAGTGNVANGSSGAGNPALFGYVYGGPAFNTDPNGELTLTDDVLEQAFDWFYNVYGGPANGDYQVYARVPGVTRGIAGGSIKSPYAEEWALGASKRLGNMGVLRVDYQHRQFKDMYETRIDTGTGTVEWTAPFGSGVTDYGLIQNSSYLERKYDAFTVQLDIQPTETIAVGGNYTWSHTRGNFDGETQGAGPITSTNNPNYYPEYRDVSWSNPVGDLAVDQRHKMRAWFVWQALSTKHHSLSVSVLQNFWSGSPYSAVGPVDSGAWGNVENPGYINPPTSVNYFFTDRGHFTTDDIWRTDVALNYSFFVDVGPVSLELFIQPEILNLFNDREAVAVNSTVLTAYNNASLGLQEFDPYTETPVEGVHWAKGSNWGTPTVEASYQLPRTFRLSLGVRF